MMNGIVNKLAELADISINVDDIIAAEATSEQFQIPYWYEESHNSCKLLLIGCDNAWYYASPCLSIYEYKADIIGGSTINHVLLSSKIYKTGTTNGTSDIYYCDFNIINTGIICRLFKNNVQDGTRFYLALALKS